MNWDDVIGIRDTELVSVDLLHFDTNNPRFTPDRRPGEDTDPAIIAELARTADLSELVQSIGTSGYINIEPLVVVVRDDKLVVLEGNRRLAALKALRNSDYARYAKLSAPEFGDEIRATFENILVYRVEREEDARELIGFKHINGPQAWDAFAKATFAARWLDSQLEAENPLKLIDIANRMGDKHATIHRMVTAYYVLMQAERMDVFNLEDRYKRAFSFSHLYTGLSYPEFTEYLGMPKPQRDQDPSREPVDTEHADNLRFLLTWLYGSKERDLQPVVRSQNPDLGRVREVLRSKSGTKVLEQTSHLDDALITATPKDRRFSKHIVEANGQLRLAMETLDGFEPETQSELQEIVNSAFKRVQLIKATVDVQMSGLEASKEK
ncbi:hypothetical protein [Leisingera sp. ANG-DT]|uniref:hypothetical protein n=1 Tax=Leisingera sp. ANG-DT TaxID=1577897 RepID=UPI0005802114|nr:hypothetical protein [Leisingera sp. ANG-DT]KIC18517.1 hypothetical protein RA21_04480 [Leisingera sp. ANG-DT]